MPSQPKTPLIALRVDRWQQDELGQFAEEREITKSDVIRRAITGEMEDEKLPHHSCRHNAYGMGCEDFDDLHARSGGSCEICGAVPRKLYIDHDHSVGLHGVRGLVCPKCNALLRRVDAGEKKPSESVAAYLADGWHLRPDRKLPEPKRTGRPRKTLGEKYATPLTTMRIPDPLKAEMAELAQESGQTLTAFALEAFEREIRRRRRGRRHTPKESTKTRPDTPTQE